MRFSTTDHPGYEYQTPVQWMSINNRRFMVVVLTIQPGSAFVSGSSRASIGASGILYDEAFHHYAATHCFSEKHHQQIGHLSFRRPELSGRLSRNCCGSAIVQIFFFLPKHHLICSISTTRSTTFGFSKGIFSLNDLLTPFIRSWLPSPDLTIEK